MPDRIAALDRVGCLKSIPLEIAVFWDVTQFMHPTGKRRLTVSIRLRCSPNTKWSAHFRIKQRQCLGLGKGGKDPLCSFSHIGPIHVPGLDKVKPDDVVRFGPAQPGTGSGTVRLSFECLSGYRYYADFSYLDRGTKGTAQRRTNSISC